MTSVGETLRRERERRNLDLEQISRETKISSRLLEAIEDERFDKLPGGVFAKSFVRQYARCLGLDEDELVGEVDRALSPAPTPAEDAAPIVKELPARIEEWQMAGESRFQFSSPLPALALVVMVMLACSLVYNWWQNRRARQPAPETRISRAAPPPAAPSPTPVTAAVPSQTDTPPPPPTAPSAPSSGEAGREAAPPAAAPPAGQSPPTPAPAPSSKPAPAASSGVANASVRLQLIAEEPTWVLVRTDGKYLFSGTLQANETRTVEAAASVLLRLGNAGGVTVTYNGKPLGPVGPKGQVRIVQFTSGGFQIVPPGPAAPKAPASDPL